MEKDSQELQQKYMEMQILSQQMQQIQQQMKMIENQLAEVATTKEALNDLKETKTGSEILAPVSNGIFLKGTLSDNQKLSINVGSGVVVEKTIPDVIKIIEEQETEIKKAYDQLTEKIETLRSRHTIDTVKPSADKGVNLGVISNHINFNL